MLEEFRSWGINRFSMSWLSQSLSGTNPREVSDKLALWGYDINLYKVPDLEAFLHAVLMMPRSVTADYDSPLELLGPWIWRRRQPCRIQNE